MLLIIHRRKLQHLDPVPAQISIGEQLKGILNQLPKEGPLFPNLAKVRSGDRATEFKQRCDGLDIKGLTLHSYRYAWAQRAKSCGYPERFAMSNLGHQSKAIHRAYAEHADVHHPFVGGIRKKLPPNSVKGELPKRTSRGGGWAIGSNRGSCLSVNMIGKDIITKTTLNL